MDIYICPMCKQENGEHQKYCLNCGTWLLNPTFPAKKKEKVRSKTTKRGFGIVALLIIAGVIWFFKGEVSSGKIVFDDVQIGNKYTVSQLVVNNASHPSISADFTIHEATNAPLEIVAVFYDSAGTRLGIASALVDNLAAGQTTTIKLDLDEPVSLSNAKTVRIEVKPLSPMMLLERAAKKSQESMGK